MKTSCFVVVFALACAAGLFGQTLNTVTAPDAAVPAPEYTLGDIGPHNRTWLNVSTTTNQLGKITTLTNGGYEEIATGLNFWDEKSGQWQESREEFEITDDGFVARHGQHVLVLNKNLNAPSSDAVRLTMPDGQQLVSAPRFLSFFDKSSGASVLIGQVKDCVGQLISSNVVVWPDAFTDVKGAIRYTYSRSGMEQDVILYENVDPAEWGLTNIAAVTLDMFSEFTNAPSLQKETAINAVNLSDDTLDFPEMRIGSGQAFLLGDAESAIPVGKSWTVISGRTFLIESVPYAAAEPLLKQLPSAGQIAARKPAPSRAQMIAEMQIRPSDKSVVRAGNRLLIPQRSFVLDYTTVNTSQTNYTFSDTVYLSGNVSLYGTNTVFSGGSALKYATNVTLTINTPVTWLGDHYWPVVMLSKDDNSCGANISGSSGNPGTNRYAAAALYFDANSANTNLVLQNVRVANAKTAIAINGKSGHVLSHVQVLNCGNGLALTNAEVSLRNALLDHVLTNFTGSTSTGRVEHLTSDTADWLNNDIGSALFLTNCLLVAVTSNGNLSASQNVNSQSTGNGVFQLRGGGAHYLIANSTNRDAGTLAICPALSNDFRQMTTFAPVLLTQSINRTTNLVPQVQRDAVSPDIGYHYDVLDFVWTNILVTGAVPGGSGLLILTNGVAVGMAGGNGVTVNGQLVSEGRADNMNRMVPCALVQEQRLPALTNLIGGNGSWGNLKLRFTDLPMIGGAAYYLRVSDASPWDGTLGAGPVTFRECRFRGGQMSVDLGENGDGMTLITPSSITLSLTNNVFDRCQLSFKRGPINPANIIVNQYNNLYHGGTLWLLFYITTLDYTPPTQPYPPYWRLYDNLFENMNLGEYGEDPWTGISWYTFVLNGYNGYINATQLQGSTGQKTLAVADFQAGPLGPFYYPAIGITNGLTNLFNAGSRLASAAGLYHFTTQTNQTKEGSTTVDIGFHYVAVDSSGNPLDTDGDGVPDYLEDSNGNGVDNSNESPWTLGIVSHPQSTNVVQGQNVTFSVTAGGVGQLTYQWRSNGVPHRRRKQLQLHKAGRAHFGRGELFRHRQQFDRIGHKFKRLPRGNDPA